MDLGTSCSHSCNNIHHFHDRTTEPVSDEHSKTVAVSSGLSSALDHENIYIASHQQQQSMNTYNNNNIASTIIENNNNSIDNGYDPRFVPIQDIHHQIGYQCNCCVYSNNNQYQFAAERSFPSALHQTASHYTPNTQYADMQNSKTYRSSTNDRNNITKEREEEYVYDSNGNIIGTLTDAMNVVLNNGEFHAMKPIILSTNNKNKPS